MTITRTRPPRLRRLVEDVAYSAPRRAAELEELLVAIDDRLEVLADPDRRARLQRGRAMLELELARELVA